MNLHKGSEFSKIVPGKVVKVHKETLNEMLECLIKLIPVIPARVIFQDFTTLIRVGSGFFQPRTRVPIEFCKGGLTLALGLGLVG